MVQGMGEERRQGLIWGNIILERKRSWRKKRQVGYWKDKEVRRESRPIGPLPPD